MSRNAPCPISAEVCVFRPVGQHDGTTSVNVVDTTAPTLKAPAAVTAECTGPKGTPVALGTATATDVCDASPVLTNDAPALFGLGTTNVTWTATDESQNKSRRTRAPPRRP